MLPNSAHSQHTGLGVQALATPATITPQMRITALPPHFPAPKPYVTPHSHWVKFKLLPMAFKFPPNCPFVIALTFCGRYLVSPPHRRESSGSERQAACPRSQSHEVTEAFEPKLQAPELEFQQGQARLQTARSHSGLLIRKALFSPPHRPDLTRHSWLSCHVPPSPRSFPSLLHLTAAHIFNRCDTRGPYHTAERLKTKHRSVRTDTRHTAGIRKTPTQLSTPIGSL